MQSRLTKYFFRWISAAAVIFLLLLPQISAAAMDEIRIGLLPEMNVFKQRQRFDPLAQYLSEKIGVKVRLTMLSRYGNIIDRLKKEKVDGAFLGSFTGTLAIHQLKVEPIARPINLDGTSTYFGHIFVRKDSGIKDVADMKDKILVMVERATTAGYIFPSAYFKRNGVKDIDTYFKDHYFSGSHDAAIFAVLNGKADVGAAKNTIYDRIKENEPRLEKEVVILESSPRVPSNGLCVISSMNSDLKSKLKEALLTIHNDPKGKNVLQKFGAHRFVETAVKDYQPVIDMADEAGISLDEYRYTN